MGRQSCCTYPFWVFASFFFSFFFLCCIINLYCILQEEYPIKLWEKKQILNLIVALVISICDVEYIAVKIIIWNTVQIITMEIYLFNRFLLNFRFLYAGFLLYCTLVYSCQYNLLDLAWLNSFLQFWLLNWQMFARGFLINRFLQTLYAGGYCIRNVWNVGLPVISLGVIRSKFHYLSLFFIYTVEKST